MSEYRVWECQVCGWVYDEAKGSAEDGIAPGTRWEDIPSDWYCPVCGARKDEFEMIALATGNAPKQPEVAASPEKKKDSNSVIGGTRIWECMVCGWTYDEARGWPEDGIAPGTRWEDIPSDWCCPECGVGKEDFDMVLVTPVRETSAAAETVPIAAAAQSNPLVIVGSGLAGYHLAREFRRLDQRTPLTIVTADDGSAYSKPLLSTSLAHGKTPQQLASASAAEMARELNAEILVHTQVIALDTSARGLDLESGGIRTQLHYRQLVLATGANCITLPQIAGDGLQRLFRVNSLEDYQRFRTALVNRKKVLLLGAGLIGCEFANDLIQSGFAVDVVDPQPWPLASLLPKGVAQDLKQSLQRAGVRFHCGTQVQAINRYGSGIAAQLSDGETIHADLVLAALGLRANINLAAAAGLTTRKGVVVNRQLQTSDANIFALGDCAEVDGHSLFFVAPLSQSARALAKTLSGTATEVCYGCLPVAIKTTLRPTVVCPPPAGADGGWQETADTDGVRAEFRQRDGSLLGFALSGSAIGKREQLADVCAPLMGKRPPKFDDK